MPHDQVYYRPHAGRNGMTERPLNVGFSRRNFDRPHGTGYRHKVNKWPTSVFTSKSHKLFVPDYSPDKQFVLIVGDSHLRSLVDGFIQMPQERISFGFMSTPGASAAQLRIEVVNAVLPRLPDAVCLLAPGNDCAANQPIGRAATAFQRLLGDVCWRWPKVCVLDFPRRLTVEVERQELLSQEYRHVAEQMGIPYWPIGDHLPLSNLNLWSWDGVHLSDSDGMPLLSELLWWAAFLLVKRREPEPKDPVPRSSTRGLVLEKGLKLLHSNPFECAGPCNKPGDADEMAVKKTNSTSADERTVVERPQKSSRPVFCSLQERLQLLHSMEAMKEALHGSMREKDCTLQRLSRKSHVWRRKLRLLR